MTKIRSTNQIQAKLQLQAKLQKNEQIGGAFAFGALSIFLGLFSGLYRVNNSNNPNEIQASVVPSVIGVLMFAMCLVQTYAYDIKGGDLEKKLKKMSAKPKKTKKKAPSKLLALQPSETKYHSYLTNEKGLNTKLKRSFSF